MYTVCPTVNLDELSDIICRDLCDTSKTFPKTVLFVHKYRDCSDLYFHLECKLGGAITFPHPNLSQPR